MSTPDSIRRLIQEDKIPMEEGLRLLTAFESAEARDRVVQEELARARKAPRGALRLPAAAALGVACVALGVLIKAAVLDPASRDSGAPAPVAGLSASSARDLDTAIAMLEHKLRRPGRAEEYRALGEAYALRAQQSNAEPDRQRAAEALARAEQIEGRTAMRGNASTFGIVFILLIAAGVAASIMVMYNGLAGSDERVNERWAQVEAVLQRRLELIPPLVETVKGAAAHERQTLMEVTEARARALGVLQATGGEAPKGEQALKELSAASESLSGALSKLLMLAERYPDLKAVANFTALQDQLEGTENRISVERQRYNDAVRAYNARLRVFPSNVVAGMFGYETREYFESKVGAEEAVPVKFGAS